MILWWIAIFSLAQKEKNRYMKQIAKTIVYFFVEKKSGKNTMIKFVCRFNIDACAGERDSREDIAGEINELVSIRRRT